MSGRKYLDFDAFWQERQTKREPIRVRVFGETHELRPSLPAAVVIKLARVMTEAESPEEEITPQDLLDVAEGLFGKELLDKWTAQGMTIDQLEALVEFVMQEYARRNRGKLRALRQEATAEKEGPKQT